ncbi:host attachment protein [Aurantiacibacter suaedae]|uniref:baeRF12 domain-containing protein n=1 Tax=Aurantiacibacter suaedae TaxID=2545755 RepID=UPI0010F60E1B|nr:host attachment protein [Aurantiacibacter suaedae]
MKCPHKAHVALVDGERFVLARNDGQPFEPKLSVVATPSLETTNYSAGVRDQDDAGRRSGSSDLEELAHAAAVTEYLNGQAIDGKLGELIVIADPKSLGEMRKHYHKELQACLIGEIDKAIANENLEAVGQAIARA